MRWSGLRHRTTLLVVGAFSLAVLALFAYASVEPDGIRFGRSPEVNRARQEVATQPTASPPTAAAPEAVALGIPLDDAALLAAPQAGEDAPTSSFPELTDGFVFASADPIVQAFAPASLVLRLRTPSTRPPTTTPPTSPPPTTPPPTTPPPTTPPPTEPPPTTPPPTEPPPTTPPPTDPPPTTPPPTEPPPTEPPPDPLIVIDLPFLPSIPLL
jgi:hypothetical protein